MNRDVNIKDKTKQEACSVHLSEPASQQRGQWRVTDELKDKLGTLLLPLAHHLIQHSYVWTIRYLTPDRSHE